MRKRIVLHCMIMSAMKRGTLRVTTMFSISGVLAVAQDQPRPQFEVASVKPAAPDQRGTFIRNMPGGRVSVTNMTLKELIQIAWRIQPFQVSGGPSWMDSARWDITAKPETTPKPDELPLMIQALLADRFQLTVHRETKELPVYALVVRKEGKLGPGLTEAKEGACTAPDMTKPLPPPEPGKMPMLNCGGMMMNPRQVRATAAPLSNLAPALSRILGRTVIDKTGLTGKYDIVLQWTPDESQVIRQGPDAPPAPPSDSAPPSIFTALQEQLGLKLESQKGPVEIFIIDRVEKPSEN
jgi:uncharacterized protein (TIGR03435 family)